MGSLGCLRSKAKPHPGTSSSLTRSAISHRHPEVRTAPGKLYLIFAIDRTSKFAFVELHEKVTRRNAADFLRRLIGRPLKAHTSNATSTNPTTSCELMRDFVGAYNFARRLKTFTGLIPHELVCKAWTSQVQRFTICPLHKMPGLNI